MSARFLSCGSSNRFSSEIDEEFATCCPRINHLLLKAHNKEAHIPLLNQKGWCNFLETEIRIWDRNVQSFEGEDTDHTSRTYTWTYGVLFLMFTTLKLFLWRMPIERCTQVRNSVDVSFHILFSAWSFFLFYCFPAAAELKWFFFFFVLLYYLYAKIPCIIILLKPLADPCVVLSVYFSHSLRPVIIIYPKGFWTCGEGGSSLQDPILLRLLGICCCYLPFVSLYVRM